MTLRDMTSATSLQELEVGRLPCDGPGSKALPASGQAPVPVSPSVVADGAAARTTSATCGRPSETSLGLVALPLFSVSRLQAPTLSERLAERLKANPRLCGSMEYAATWKELVTPAGLRLWAHTASARRTAGNGCIGWPSPSATVYGENLQREMDRRARLKEKHGNGNGAGLTLGVTAQLAGWPTPDAMQGAGGAQDAEKRIAGGHHVRLQDAATLAAQAGQGLPLAGWSTPDTVPDAPCMGSNATKTTQGLGNQARGVLATSSPAGTGNPGAFRLNPRFSLWLMGYPDAWASCGERAMLSCRNARQSSSRHGLRQQENANE